MRTPPEHRRAHPRAGRTYEEDLNLRYLAPGAFTILPPDDGAPPLPPSAPAPYRLTPSTKRHKNPAFAIIGEPTSSNHGSRSSSPSGRVSPFKGRGFNATGSRFASPNPSPPPPEDARLTPTKVSPRHTSKIPKYSRRGSATAFGEKVIHYEPSFGTKDPQGSTRRNNLNSNQLSQSLSSLEAKQQTSSRKRPPISPRKRPHSKAIAFQRLSPIIGSSPEPSQSQSSPSRIPTKSRSTPPSRFTSPTRLDNEKKSVSKPPSRSVSRSQLRPSRDPSPSDNSSSSTAKNTGVKKSYRNVQAKVNSFSRPKPKVPPKPQFVSEQSEESDIPPSKNSNNKTKPTLSRNNSITKRTNDNKSSILQKTFNKNQVNNNNSDSSSTDTSKKINSSNKNNSGNVNISNTVPNTKNNVNNNKPTTDKAKNQAASKTNNNSSSNKNIPKRNSREDLLTLPKTQMKQTNPDSSDSTTEDTDHTKDTNHHPLPSAVVSSTTSTVTKPLHIEAKLPTATYDRPKPVSPMVDGRILSATSVSHALNKMNDTVMNTQTVIKEHGLGKLSPAASAVIAVANEEKDKDVKDLKDKSAKDSKDDAKDNKSVGVPKNGSGTNKSTSVSTGIVETPKTDSIKQAAVDNVNTNANPNVPKSVGTNPNVGQSNHSNHNSSNNVATNNNNNISNNHVSHIGLGTSKAIELEVQRNMDKLISADGTLIDNSVKKSANDRIREARTMIAADVQPIKITVREKPSDIEVQSGNVRLPVNVSNGINDIRPSLPQNNHQQSPPTSNEPSKEEPPKNACSRFFTSFKDRISCECCKKCKNLRPGKTNQAEPLREENEKTKGCFPWMKRHKEKDQSRVTINIENETEKKKFWDRIKCCNRNKIGDTGSCFPTGRRKESWMDSRETMLSNAEQSRGCSKVCCKNFFRKMFCINLCCKKKEVPPPESRKASIISSNKKKSLTPGTTLPPPSEDTTPKIDISLVEHTSHMRGAIPVLPVYLAWFCLFLNCIFPGSGTAISGLFCLCIGKPRFSQKDGIKPRIGAFIIDLIIGFSQFFTVLFCLVGWGWSIWWGVIMIKVAKKHKKIRHMEVLEENASKPIPVGQSNNRRDPAHGS